MFEKHCQFHIITQVLEVFITSCFSLDLSFQSLKRANGTTSLLQVRILSVLGLPFQSSIKELRRDWRRTEGRNMHHQARSVVLHGHTCV